jgi:two-component system, NarL family, sensor kinase
MAELPQSEIIYIFIIGTVGMLSLTVGFAIFITVYQKRMLQEQDKQRKLELEYQQKMIQSQIESQEIERKRIAADLHDSIGSLLWAAKLNVAFLGRSVNLVGELKVSYDETMAVLDQSIDSVKRISWELTPEAFQHSGFSSSVRDLCSRLNGKGQSLIFEENKNTFWNDDRALMTFRIVQELVNNAVKHSKGTLINVGLKWNDNKLQVLVNDNGIGFSLEKTVRKGVGWWNIQQRAAKIGADVKLHENIVEGSSVELNVPLTYEEA